MAAAAHHLFRYPPPPSLLISSHSLRANPSSLSFPSDPSTKAAQIPLRSPGVVSAGAQEPQGDGGRGRRIWRRRKLTKKDEKLQYKMERIPFLEEQVRMIRETGEIMSMDIEKLMLSEENRFDFVNEVAAEAKSYVEKNRDEYGSKKAILHVLSNRMNEAGFERSEAYMEPDPFKPGPNFLREYL